MNYKSLKEFIFNTFFPIIRFFKSIIILINEKRLTDHYDDVLQSIRQRDDKIIRFAAYVMYDSDYGFDSVFMKMMESESIFIPRVVIIPDVLRGSDYARTIYNRTKNFFIQKYGEEYVLDGWDMQDEYYDLIDCFDVIYYNNPYDIMAHEFHKIKYSINKFVLPIYVTYGYEISAFYTHMRLCSKEINYLWRCYTDTLFSYNDYKKYETRKGRNVKLIGYSKMDNLHDVLIYNKLDHKKTILISIHHTVADKKLPLSNFLRYYKLFLDLPEMFPEIEFIFRPHPLLFVTLEKKRIWSREEIDEYLTLLKSKGVIYSDGGAYFDIFFKADAIINDCGSFTIEWLLTGKPGCFLMNPNLKESSLTTLMQEAIKEYDIAKNENDVISFIKNINSQVRYPNYQMKKWVKDKIAINYPNVADSLLEDIRRSIYE